MSGAVLKRVLLMVRGILSEAGSLIKAVLALELSLEKVGVRWWWCR